ncbi:uncharacterized protein LOC142775817 [Rhipicephalus microplus]|uniref:uncharacterized protein LOC142775817 n=1 Tax=Rhipicephalus microplus TaxID=6941 RepID=UPI003F6B3D79
MQILLLSAGQLPPIVYADHLYCKPRAILASPELPYFPATTKIGGVPDVDTSMLLVSSESPVYCRLQDLLNTPQSSLLIHSTPRARTRARVSTPHSFTSRIEGAASIDGTPRPRMRTKKVLTPYSKKRLQRFCDKNSPLRQIDTRLQKPKKPTRSQLLFEAGRYLSKVFVEILKVQMHLQPLKEHGR